VGGLADVKVELVRSRHGLDWRGLLHDDVPLSVDRYEAPTTTSTPLDIDAATTPADTDTRASSKFSSFAVQSQTQSPSIIP